MAAVKMFAKFAGTCVCCKNKFAAGTQIMWEKNTGAQHVACSASGETASPAAPAKPAYTSVIQQRRRAASGARKCGLGCECSKCVSDGAKWF